MINLDTKRINFILIYITLFRVRYITSLAIESYIAFDRFLKNLSLFIKLRINDTSRRLNKSIS